MASIKHIVNIMNEGLTLSADLFIPNADSLKSVVLSDDFTQGGVLIAPQAAEWVAYNTITSGANHIDFSQSVQLCDTYLPWSSIWTQVPETINTLRVHGGVLLMRIWMGGAYTYEWNVNFNIWESAQKDVYSFQTGRTRLEGSNPFSGGSDSNWVTSIFLQKPSPMISRLSKEGLIFRIAGYARTTALVSGNTLTSMRIKVAPILTYGSFDDSKLSTYLQTTGMY